MQRKEQPKNAEGEQWLNSDESLTGNLDAASFVANMFETFDLPPHEQGQQQQQQQQQGSFPAQASAEAAAPQEQAQRSHVHIAPRLDVQEEWRRPSDLLKRQDTLIAIITVLRLRARPNASNQYLLDNAIKFEVFRYRSATSLNEYMDQSNVHTLLNMWESTQRIEMSQEESTSKNIRPLVAILTTSIKENDVLIGKRITNNLSNNNGLRNLRRLIDANRAKYKNGEKSIIAKLIVEAIQSTNPPGRFLKRVTKGGFHVWFELADHNAQRKVMEAISDRIKYLKSREGTETAAPGHGDNTATKKRKSKGTAAAATKKAEPSTQGHSDTTTTTTKKRKSTGTAVGKRKGEPSTQDKGKNTASKKRKSTGAAAAVMEKAEPSTQGPDDHTTTVNWCRWLHIDGPFTLPENQTTQQSIAQAGRASQASAQSSNQPHATSNLRASEPTAMQVPQPSQQTFGQVSIAPAAIWASTNNNQPLAAAHQQPPRPPIDWRDPSDLVERQTILLHIISAVVSAVVRRTPYNAKEEDQLEIARRLEVNRYCSAASLEDYKDKSTIPHLVNTWDFTRTNELLQEQSISSLPANIRRVFAITTKDINENDVLFGNLLTDILASLGPNNGNDKYQQLIDKKKQHYSVAEGGDKTKISDAIVEKIHSANPPGRFLKRVTKGTFPVWIELADHRPREMVRRDLCGTKRNEAKRRAKSDNASAIQRKSTHTTSSIQPFPAGNTVQAASLNPPPPIGPSLVQVPRPSQEAFAQLPIAPAAMWYSTNTGQPVSAPHHQPPQQGFAAGSTMPETLLHNANNNQNRGALNQPNSQRFRQGSNPTHSAPLQNPSNNQGLALQQQNMPQGLAGFNASNVAPSQGGSTNQALGSEIQPLSQADFETLEREFGQLPDANNNNQILEPQNQPPQQIVEPAIMSPRRLPPGMDNPLRRISIDNATNNNPRNLGLPPPPQQNPFYPRPIHPSINNQLHPAPLQQPPQQLRRISPPANSDNNTTNSNPSNAGLPPVDHEGQRRPPNQRNDDT